jgi:Ca-activated chloride channel family protein
MKRNVYFIVSMMALVALLLAGCGGAALQTVMGTPPPEMMVVEESYALSAPMEAPLWDGPYPSTGGLEPPNDEPYADVFFEDYGVNPFIDTEDDNLSTFAVDVDTASYTVMRRYVNDGHLPPDESVRVEEYINYFDQEYEPPAEGSFAIHLEGAPSPYGGERYHLVRVGLQSYTIPPEMRKDAVLTFVIDVSGSMDMENRLGLVKQALRLLVEELRPTDRVGIVVYANQAYTVLEHTSAAEPEVIMRAIDRLQPSGSTYAEEGLVEGYQLAAAAFDPEASNRVILCSDGVANVGRTGPDSILERIREYADQGITLTSVGFGMGNYNDILLEQLANDGDGQYAYVDTLDEAERLFVDDLTSTLQIVARDAKIQVVFNPEVVSRYRLIGYENRAVADEDFRNDEVDAGEIGVGHSVTALYECKFYEDSPAEAEAMTVYVRFEEPDGGKLVELSRSISRAEFAATFEQASPRFQLDAVVAEFAEILRESYWAQESSLEDVLAQARRVAEYLPGDPDVAEFVALLAQASRVSE